MQVQSSSSQPSERVNMAQDIYRDNNTIEFCRDLIMRTHGKFSVGSDRMFHRFAIEIMPCGDGFDIRVWELTHNGCSFDFLTDGQHGSLLRTVVNLGVLSEMDNPPKFAVHLLDFLDKLNVDSYHPKYIYLWCKLDFEGKIWNTPKVYVRNICLSADSLSELCEDESKSYVERVFHPNNFRDFRKMHG